MFSINFSLEDLVQDNEARKALLEYAKQLGMPPQMAIFVAWSEHYDELVVRREPSASTPRANASSASTSLVDELKELGVATRAANKLVLLGGFTSVDDLITFDVGRFEEEEFGKGVGAKSVQSVVEARNRMLAEKGMEDPVVRRTEEVKTKSAPPPTEKPASPDSDRSKMARGAYERLLFLSDPNRNASEDIVRELARIYYHQTGTTGAAFAEEEGLVDLAVDREERIIIFRDAYVQAFPIQHEQLEEMEDLAGRLGESPSIWREERVAAMFAGSDEAFETVDELTFVAAEKFLDQMRKDARSQEEEEDALMGDDFF